MTNTWTTQELGQLSETLQLRVATARRDGSMRAPVIVWMVRVGDEVYTRSVNGPDAAWFRGTRVRHEGHVQAGAVDADVTFVDVGSDDGIHADIDAAYRAKYGSTDVSVAVSRLRLVISGPRPMPRAGLSTCPLPAQRVHRGSRVKGGRRPSQRDALAPLTREGCTRRRRGPDLHARMGTQSRCSEIDPRKRHKSPKYHQYRSPVEHITSPLARSTTLKLIPRQHLRGEAS